MRADGTFAINTLRPVHVIVDVMGFETTVNARGGFGGNNRTTGKLYVLKIHDDVAQWGASSTEAVKMAFDEHVVAVLGSIDGASTHIMLRVNLKLEVPIMDTGTTDPTVTETRIPWVDTIFLTIGNRVTRLRTMYLSSEI